MNKCEKFCNNKFISISKKYTKKYHPNKINLFNHSLVVDAIKNGCKEDLCNIKCKHTK